MKKSTMVIIIVCVSIFTVAVFSPFILTGVILGGLTIFNMSKPDFSDDPLLPSGYVDNDGEQSYGAGDWINYGHFVYDEKPQLDECFQEVTDDNQEPIRKLFDGVPEMKLSEKISNGDYYYIESIINKTKTGGMIYYYDIEQNTFYILDYGF